ncbi:hypothetical protein [Cupriavidus oxalaticus]|uniref:hypothetical protein n=1 Tax=Cupriavidus oxalaticus TaxID=96344 RepID=UPI00317C49D8
MSVRLSQNAWIAIKSAYLQGRTARDLAQRFGVTAGTIHKRSSLERWRDGVPVPPGPVASENLTAKEVA